MSSLLSLGTLSAPTIIFAAFMHKVVYINRLNKVKQLARKNRYTWFILVVEIETKIEVFVLVLLFPPFPVLLWSFVWEGLGLFRLIWDELGCVLILSTKWIHLNPHELIVQDGFQFWEKTALLHVIWIPVDWLSLGRWSPRDSLPASFLWPSCSNYVEVGFDLAKIRSILLLIELCLGTPDRELGPLDHEQY